MTTIEKSIDRKTAEVLMRHTDAIDLLLGSMIEAISDEVADASALRDGVFRVVNEMHVSIRAPIIKRNPDLDRDR